MNTSATETAAGLQHVTILGYEKALGTSLTIPMEMLNAADLISKIHGGGQPRIELQLASLDGSNIPLTSGLELVCRTALHQITHSDLIILPALWGNPRGIIRSHAAILPWLREQAANNIPICAVGTGSYFLAEAGLLDNKIATTHWYYFDQFAKLYPAVELHRERFVTRAGNLYCTGSVNAVRDVMLHFIEEYYDEEIANQVSRHFTHELKSSHTASFLKTPRQNLHDDEDIIEIQEWMIKNFSSDIDFRALSSRFGFSQRTLNRRFRQASGKSPLQYLQELRIDKAKELLRTSNYSIAEVAFTVGYHDSAYFTKLFRQSVSLTPREYRLLVRKKIFKVDI